MSARLDGKIVLVTGAAQGMGRAIVLEAAAAGAAFVAIADIKEAAGQDVAEAIRATGVEAHFIATDLREPAAIAAMIGQTVQRAGGLDVLVNNAGVTDDGVAHRVLTVETLTEAVWDTVMDINLKAMWLAIKYAAPHLRASRRGPAIVNGASVASTAAYPGLPAYAVSKAGVVLLTQAAAVDLAPDGIRCNAFAPGAIDTPMLSASFDAFDDSEAAAVRLWGPHLIRRLGRADEVAKLVCFLASDDASFCTGGVYRADGGTLAWRGVHQSHPA